MQLFGHNFVILIRYLANDPSFHYYILVITKMLLKFIKPRFVYTHPNNSK